MKSSKTFVMTAALILAANWVGAVGARNVDWPTYGGSSGSFRAYDPRDGRILSTLMLPGGTSSAP